MEFRADGKFIELHLVGCQELNYGQVRDFVRLPFEMVIDRHFIEEHLTPIYAKLVAELRADDDLYNNPEPVELRTLGYPPLKQTLVQHPALFQQMVLTYLHHDLLNLVLPKAIHVKYLINDIEKVTCEPSKIILHGWVLPMP